MGRARAEGARQALDLVDFPRGCARAQRPFEERALLLEVEPETFFITPHYRGHGLVLVRPERLDPAWVRANLVRVWRRQAPKRLLRACDAAHRMPDAPPPTTGRRRVRRP